LRKLATIPKGSLFFAPMEGITDEAFRKTILKLYPEWDYLATDFLRVPSAGRYPLKFIFRHMGKDMMETEDITDKTMFQILTSHKSFTIDMVRQITELNIPWLDMNIGCPSNTVCKNRGGSYLLTNLHSLGQLVRDIRQNFPGRFTCKVRIGYHDTEGFEDSIRMLNDEGVDMITVHARTRDDMYKAPARWEFIKRAVELSGVPIIGNGDVWCSADIERMLSETGCHGIMIGRGALKAPWIAQDYRRGFYNASSSETLERIKTFFQQYRSSLEAEGISQRGLLKQSKSVSRFMFDEIPSGQEIKRKLMLTQATEDFFKIIEDLSFEICH
jgi:tRNA-dihydrouridine synthase B